MRTPHYPSDVTDDQWALVEPLIPVYPGGRPRKTANRLEPKHADAEFQYHTAA